MWKAPESSIVETTTPRPGSGYELELLLDELDSEDSELLLDELDSEDSELLLDELDSEDSELLLDELDPDDSEDPEDPELPDGLEDEGSGAVGRALVVQPPRAPTPARVAPPESRIRNSRRSDRYSSVSAGCGASFFSSVMTPLSQGAEAFPMATARR